MHRNISPHKHLNHFTPFIRTENSEPTSQPRQAITRLRDRLTARLHSADAELAFAGTIFFCLGMKIAEII